MSFYLTKLCSNYRCCLSLVTNAAQCIFILTAGHPGAIMSERTSDFEAKKMSEEIEELENIEMDEHPQLEPEHSGILYSTMNIYRTKNFHLMSNQRWKRTISTPRWPRGTDISDKKILLCPNYHTFFDDMLTLGWISVPTDLDYFITYEVQAPGPKTD